MKDIDKMIAIVDGILGDDGLCDGCADGREEGVSCYGCRRLYADKIIKILREKKDNDIRAERRE